MIDTHGPELRNYRRGRQTYKLTANEALAYSRSLAALSHAAFDGWRFEVETDAYFALMADESILVVSLVDANDEVVDSCTIDLDHSISDHGNLNYDDNHPDLVQAAGGLLANHSDRNAT